jgi:hypothetical protein
MMNDNDHSSGEMAPGKSVEDLFSVKNNSPTSPGSRLGYCSLIIDFHVTNHWLIDSLIVDCIGGGKRWAVRLRWASDLR